MAALILWPWLFQQGCGPLVLNTPQSSPNQTVQTKALSPFDIWIVLSRTDEFAFPVQLTLAALGFIPGFWRAKLETGSRLYAEGLAKARGDMGDKNIPKKHQMKGKHSCLWRVSFRGLKSSL